MYMRPLAQILDAPATARAGDTLTVHAADASKTLAENGYAGFDFVMGFDGAAGDYVYEWYLGQVDAESKIAGCSTATCAFTVPNDVTEKASTFSLILVVKDLSSPNQSEGTDAVDITVPLLFLPTVARPQ